jgi:hypothetical protein
MKMISKQFTATELRCWADRCATEAFDGQRSEEDIQRLWKMNKALHELAQTQDWLDGNSGVTVEFVLPPEKHASWAM